MRVHLKKELSDILKTILKANQGIKSCMKAGQSDSLAELLEECQNAAISVGNSIEESEGEGTEAVHALEEYCEYLYRFSTGEETSVARLDGCINKCLNEIISFKETKEIVFLPYKASMWDSLESVYKEKKSEEGTHAIVVPIPYFDKNPDGTFKEAHYEIAEYPADIPVVDYRDYDFDGRHPDEIYIHNPYDEWNLVTSVHPDFYSPRLQKYTDKLIYIPYFVLNDPKDPDDAKYLESIEHFVTVPGVVNSDLVLVQSENMAKAYINILMKAFKEAGNKQMSDRKMWEGRIHSAKSPKLVKVENLTKEDIPLPDEWMKFVKRSDGSMKKIILYNNSVGALLKHQEKMIEKLRDSFHIFYENRDDVALLWRPHPLIKATIESMHPELCEQYNELVKEYCDAGWGIYDDSSDLDRALVWADAYYGDPSSLVQLCQARKIPIMIQNPKIVSECEKNTST